jgi:hypothetical protein
MFRGDEKVVCCALQLDCCMFVCVVGHSACVARASPDSKRFQDSLLSSPRRSVWFLEARGATMARGLFVGGVVVWLITFGIFIYSNVVITVHAMRRGHRRLFAVWRFALSDEFEHPRRTFLRFGLFGGLIAILVLSLLGFVAILYL